MRSQKHLGLHIPPYVLEVITVLETNGHQAWLVGGCVRDLLQAVKPQDYDIATEATPDQVALLFDHHIMTGYRHGTITVLIDHHPVEVTTFRSESEYSDGRRPDLVTFHSDITTDLLRRDFTINSMAWHPRRGLLDPAHGQDDLEKRVLRCVGDPDQRFSEDGLRLLRALRFCVMLDLTVSETTLAAAGRQAWRIKQLSHERIWGELRKVMSSPYPMRMMPFAQTSVLETAVQVLFGPICPLRPLTDSVAACSQPDRSEAELVAILLLLACTATDQQAPCLKRDIGRWTDKRVCSDWRKHLVSQSRLSRKISEDALLMLYWLGLLAITAPEVARTEKAGRQRTACLLRLLYHQGSHHDRSALKRLISQAAGLSDQIVKIPDAELRSVAAAALIEQIPLSVKDLEIRGSDLLAIGLRQGPELQIILERLLSYALRQSGSVPHTDLMRLAVRMARRRSSESSIES